MTPNESAELRRRRRAPPFPVTVDTREPEHTAWTFSADVAITRACLASGDYAPTGFETRCAIERKTAGDFIACVTYERERFWSELARLRSFDFAAVIVETSVEAIIAGAFRSRANPWAVCTSALAIMVDFGIPVLFADDHATGARCCEWMLKRWVAKQAAPEAPDAA